MKRTPDSISKARQKARDLAEVWRAGIAAARRELALDPAARAEVERRVAYAQAQIAVAAKELKDLRRAGRRQFWK
jgi:hypothetical protein